MVKKTIVLLVGLALLPVATMAANIQISGSVVIRPIGFDPSQTVNVSTIGSPVMYQTIGFALPAGGPVGQASTAGITTNFGTSTDPLAVNIMSASLADLSGTTIEIMGGAQFRSDMTHSLNSLIGTGANPADYSGSQVLNSALAGTHTINIRVK